MDDESTNDKNNAFNIFNNISLSILAHHLRTFFTPLFYEFRL